MSDTIKPLNLKCTCGHVFAIGYLPLPLEAACRLMQTAKCPLCGEAKGLSILGKQI